MNSALLECHKTRMESQNFFEQLSDVQRYFLMLYLLIVLIASLVGDAIILIASTRYNALKLNKFILVIIHHISVCDLITDFNHMLPTFLALSAEKWVFGNILTNITVLFANWSFFVSNLLIGMLICSKYFLVRFPQKTRNWSWRKAHIACGAAWIAVLPLSSIWIVPDKLGKMLIDYHTGSRKGENIDRDVSSFGWNYLFYTSMTTFILSGTPVLVFIVTLLTLKQLFEARQVSRRSRGSLRWQGIVTVVFTGAVFCVSMLPHSVYFVMATFFGYETRILRILQVLTNLNTASNFFIFCWTVKSFRAFLWARISRLRSKFWCQNRIANENSE